MSDGVWSFKLTRPDDHENPDDYREGEYAIFRAGECAAIAADFQLALFITEACNAKEKHRDVAQPSRQ